MFGRRRRICTLLAAAARNHQTFPAFHECAGVDLHSACSQERLGLARAREWKQEFAETDDTFEVDLVRVYVGYDEIMPVTMPRCMPLVRSVVGCKVNLHQARSIRRGVGNGGTGYYRPVRFFSGQRKIFFSHNKSVNNTFSHDLSAKRTGHVTTQTQTKRELKYVLCVSENRRELQLMFSRYFG